MKTVSAETRAKLSLALKGKPKSRKHAAHCRTVRLGAKLSASTRRKLSDAAREQWFRKKIKELS